MKRADFDLLVDVLEELGARIAVRDAPTSAEDARCVAELQADALLYVFNIERRTDSRTGAGPIELTDD